MAEKERRRFDRSRLRIPCEYGYEGGDHSGFVQDVSARGVFIQTSLLPDEGTELRVRIHEPELGKISLIGRVTRKRVTHRAAAAIKSGGFSIEVLSADEGFFQLLLRRGLG